MDKISENLQLAKKFAINAFRIFCGLTVFSWAAAAFWAMYLRDDSKFVNFTEEDAFPIIICILFGLIGLSIVFPKIVGGKLLKILKLGFWPLSKTLSFIGSVCDVYDNKHGMPIRTTRVRLFKSSFFFFCAIMFLFAALATQSKPEEPLLQTLFIYLMIAGEIAVGMGIIFPERAKILAQKSGLIAVKFWNVIKIIIAVICLIASPFIIWWIFQGIGEAVSRLSTSAAILIGAVIIALAVQSKNNN